MTTSTREDGLVLLGTFVRPELAEQVKLKARKWEQSVAGFLVAVRGIEPRFRG